MAVADEDRLGADLHIGPAPRANVSQEGDRVDHVIDAEVDSQRMPGSLRIHTLPAITSTSMGATLSPIVCVKGSPGRPQERVVVAIADPDRPFPNGEPDGLPPTGISPTIVSVPGSMTATDSPMKLHGHVWAARRVASGCNQCKQGGSNPRV